MSDSREKCPTCESRHPHLHPAIQCGGEVQPCRDEFHKRVTPQNTPEMIAEVARHTTEVSTLSPSLSAKEPAPAVQTEKPDGVEPLLEALREDVIGIAAELKKCKDCKHRWSLTRLAYCEEQLDRQIAAYSQARGQKEG